MRKFLVVLGLCAVLAVVAAESSDVKASPWAKLFLNKMAPQPPVMDVESRIIGGEAAKESVAPYIVSISISNIAYAHTCAGSIINRNWILTAAHCTKVLESVIGLPVYAGLLDRSNVEQAQKRIIDFAFSNKGFDGSEGSADIALLHVSQPFEFTVNVRPIALPSVNEDYTGKQSTTYGWGLDDADAGAFVKDLRLARADVINPSECLKTLPADAPITQNTICARVGACYGDGGSPLVIEVGGSGLELIGIASWGYIPCGYEQRPTAYIPVSSFVTWINEVQWAYGILN